MAMNRRPTIAYLGPLPPPIGGISVALQRLTKQLKENNFDCVVYDLLNKKMTGSDGIVTNINNRLLWLLRYFFFAKEDLICCHHVDWKLRTATGIMTLLGKKTLISIGGQGLNDALERGSWLKKKVIEFSVRHYSYVIAQNPVIRQLCLSLGVKEERIEIIYSFIPPVVKEEDTKAIPQHIWDFIKRHSPVMAINAFKLVFYQNQDLYGLDLCVDLCANLKASYPDIGFVFCLPNIGDQEYLDLMKKKLVENHIEDNFLFVIGFYPFYPILMKSQVFLRPTNTDGDATSLREALFFKVPSVASDVFPRPTGTILFENRDINDLTQKVRELLNNYQLHKAELETVTIEDNFTKLMSLYRKLLNPKH